jgi:pyruvate,water dikinase
MQTTIPFSKISIDDISLVGGKNASLGEMYSVLTQEGILVPNGFAVTAHSYWLFLKENDLVPVLTSILTELDTSTFSNLQKVGEKARAAIMQATMPESIQADITHAFEELEKSEGVGKSYAVRSSATAEDLPNASFAGQQETYLNVKGIDNLLKACHRCYASLFTDRAIKYRVDNGFEHMKVALSVGVQTMIRSDLASSGVMFTMDPDTGFEQVVLVTGSWGLGENVVQGSVNTDEFLVFKPKLNQVKQSVIAHKLGSKAKTMVYSQKGMSEIVKPEDAVVNNDTAPEMQDKFILTDAEVTQLANWATVIQKHYKRHMDIEWAKDGMDGKMYIVQARPETVHGGKKQTVYKQYTLLEKGKQLCAGAGLGNKIVAGKAKILHSPSEISKLNEGEILVTERTDPDWDPVLKKAAAIITDQGGRTSHAAIVARELGAIAVVGTGNATQNITDGQFITVSTAQGDTGVVYEGMLKWDEKAIDITTVPKTKTKVMLILAHPDEAFGYSLLPNDGVGLMRMEFIVSNAIGIHPMALRHFERITDATVKEKIEKITRQFENKEEFFVQRLAEATAKMAAAFYPKDVIVRMSDFKSNEYANLLGGKQFEPEEENPMIGFRGASRYYHPLYKEAFEMECKAMKIVRDDMGLTNVKLMIPFCRTTTEAQKVREVMKMCGLERGANGLELYVMIEIPSNALLAEEFAKYFDGFSIGSNDLTQLTLGADRDSELLSEIFSPFDPAVMQLIEMTLQKAQKSKTHTGLCGQAPSDYPEYAKFLVKNGIDSISFNPDALIQGIQNIYEAEKANTKAPTLTQLH